tara:strand:- start:212 stop:802 length:591 start_codon:yes stop_codon:yes gene_type:complete
MHNRMKANVDLTAHARSANELENFVQKDDFEGLAKAIRSNPSLLSVTDIAASGGQKGATEHTDGGINIVGWKPNTVAKYKANRQILADNAKLGSFMMDAEPGTSMSADQGLNSLRAQHPDVYSRLSASIVPTTAPTARKQQAPKPKAVQPTRPPEVTPITSDPRAHFTKTIKRQPPSPRSLQPGTTEWYDLHGGGI